MRGLLCNGLSAIAALAALASPTAGQTHESGAPSPAIEARVASLLGQMTLEEKLTLVNGRFPRMMKSLPAGVIPSAGYVAGVARLGVPEMKESDASLGVANAGRTGDDAVALPSALALAASWDADMAYAGGAMIGGEARHKGFNVLLAGGVNLVRDPFNGRNFEYLGEDPLLAGRMAAASVRGVQSQHVISTVKHFVLNAQETGRHVLDARIGEAALRESDLLAFEIAIESGAPGAVMCAYNKVGGAYACENPHILTDVLKTDWGWKGFVMSDWGAVHTVEAARAGLDQESGQELDQEAYFDAPLRAALADGRVSLTRLNDMVGRILRSQLATGLMDPLPAAGPYDKAADAAIAQAEAEAGLLLLKNEGDILPLAAGARRIAVIGGHADVGVLSGGGSSQVIPAGSLVRARPAASPAWSEGIVYHPSSPLAAIRSRAGSGVVQFDPGEDIASAARLARDSDVAVVFAEQWTTEGADAPLSLSDHQEALIGAVATANPRTIVVLENGGPVLMPWIDAAKAVVEAWYPGQRGGEAIARLLFGEVSPKGRLPVTFAAGPDQLVRPSPPGLAMATAEGLKPEAQAPFAVNYVEGSSVGYRWFAEKDRKPLFPFGYGLSYTRFHYGRLKATGGSGVTVQVEVANIGQRPGVAVAQLYLAKSPGRTQQRLLGWRRVALKPGERRRVEITAEPRLLADWDEAAHDWRIRPGAYALFVGDNADDRAATAQAVLRGAELKP
ncbi:glycoside hydrolase family 3 C-terminal domain-containing protein [Phenylobacterium montanum]|uniref:Glycoside hydrolase family 3 C-terminal domain-containing protein n=2 Tax=Phenylobacterium montanum TaxID=2823693 RepID=A0A975IXL4_9CAUL|nr:glycoside hydrolase family 3 C-terminal domain-containing protein [Caulobacter sp. S6]